MNHRFLLAHHHPHRHYRCAKFGGRPVCRRCLWATVGVVVSAAAAAAGVWAPSLAIAVAGVVLGLPVLADIVLEAIGAARYRPCRVAAFSLLGGIGLGVLASLPSRLMVVGLLLGLLPASAAVGARMSARRRMAERQAA